MLKKMELIDTTVYSIKELRELAKDDNVFIIYNSYQSLRALLKRNNRIEMLPEDPNECWHVKPLSRRINDEKTDLEVEEFIRLIEANTCDSVFRIEIA